MKVQRTHFLVDHGVWSRSTHRFWWRHIRDGIRANGENVLATSKSLGNVSLRRVRGPKVFWYFTEGSLTDRLADLIAKDDLVLTWQGLDEFRRFTPRAYVLGFPGQLWMDDYVLSGGKPSDVILFQPFVPLKVARILRRLAGREPKYDAGFFGTIWPSNYDQFENVLAPLASEFRCRYRGLFFDVPSKVSSYGFSRRLTSERVGWRILAESRINLSVSHIEHRRKQSVTERVFSSSALGRAVVADNLGVRDFYPESEVMVGATPSEFLDRCRHLIANPNVASSMSQRAQQRTLKEYTYRETINRVLDQIRSFE